VHSPVQHHVHHAQHHHDSSNLEDIFSVKEILAILTRHLRLIALCLVAGLLCSMIYIFFAQPRYTATTSILIDPGLRNTMADFLGERSNMKDNLVLESQIAVIRSLKLQQKAAIKAGVITLSASENDTKSSQSSQSSQSTQNTVLTQEQLARVAGFRSGLRVERLRGTYVIEISYTASNPQRAASMANLIADVYLEDDLEAQFEASERTNQWLRSRLSFLRNELTQAEQAVETFKEKNDLIHTAGKTLSEQQLAELNAQLADARAESAHALSRVNRIERMIEQKDTSLVVTESISNRSIAGLHDKYIELSRLAIEIKRKQGENHEAFQTLKRQMDDIEAIIISEYERIAESHRADYEVAQARLEMLQQQLEDAIQNTSGIRRNEIELRELERRAVSTRNLYTRMLDNFNEQTERQTVPIVNARIISPAQVPSNPSWPNKNRIMFIGLILGSVMGAVLVFLKEQLNRFLWKPEEIEAVTHRTCLGMLPKVAFDSAKLARLDASDPALSKGFNREGFEEITQLLNKQTGVITEIMRNIQLAIAFRKQDAGAERNGQIISFVSARPSEGKSVTSCFLAKHLAKSDAKVLLIDCDFRRPSLTNWFISGARSGFYELASEFEPSMSQEKILADLAAITHKAADEGLYFIPAKGASTAITNLNLISSGQMHALLNLLKTQYDAVLIDLPPIINIVDARVIASKIDSFVFLSHWGMTDRDMVKKALLRAPEVHDKTKGVLLTLVDTEKASTYGYYNYNYYYQR
jgi:polysaccharide biosynthesis transport protein